MMPSIIAPTTTLDEKKIVVERFSSLLWLYMKPIMIVRIELVVVVVMAAYPEAWAPGRTMLWKLLRTCQGGFEEKTIK